MRKNFISAEALDEKFDKGEDVVEYLDLAKVERPGLKPYRVNIAFPLWMVKELAHEAESMGVPRQAVIKYWIAESLKP